MNIVICREWRHKYIGLVLWTADCCIAADGAGDIKWKRLKMPSGLAAAFHHALYAYSILVADETV